MTRSMAPTIAKLNSMAVRTASEISGTNYRAGFDAGKRHAYTRMGWAMAALAAAGVIVAWVTG